MVELTVRIKKTGINGTGHAYGQVVFLDNAPNGGNTLWKSPVVHEQQGAVLGGVARDQQTQTFTVDLQLLKKTARVIVIVSARDGTGLPDSLKEFTKKLEEIRDALRTAREVISEAVKIYALASGE